MNLYNPGPLNRYGYMNGDPVNGNDPLGLDGGGPIAFRAQVSGVAFNVALMGAGLWYGQYLLCSGNQDCETQVPASAYPYIACLSGATSSSPLELAVLPPNWFSLPYAGAPLTPPPRGVKAPPPWQRPRPRENPPDPSRAIDM